MIKVIFFGTSEFAVPSLKALIEDPRFSVEGVVTQPDRAKGRRQVMTPPPIKELALAAGIKEIKQPVKLKDEDFKEWITTVGKDADVFIVTSYGKILPQWLLDIPKKGCINVHGSLLPRWRGASPVQAAIAAGDEKSGVTVMMMDADLDHGAILSMKETAISDTDTGGRLHNRLAELGGDILVETIADYIDGKITPEEQEHSRATFCKKMTREDGRIDWNDDCHVIQRMIRAYDPWPGAWMEIDGKRLKLKAAEIRPNDACHSPGGRYLWKNKPHIKCGGNTALELMRVQPEGKKAMSGEDFARGNEWR